MARFEFLRPYILGSAAMMLAWAFWHVYRTQHICAEGTCAPGPSVWLKSTLWFVAALTHRHALGG